MILGIFDYRLEVMDFILKYDMEIVESKIKVCIKIVYKRYIKEKNYCFNFFIIYLDFLLWKILFDEVIYFEISIILYKIKLVIIFRIFEFYKSLKFLLDLDVCFICVYKFFVVNKYYIVFFDLKKNNIKMSNGYICCIFNIYRNILKNIIKI